MGNLSIDGILLVPESLDDDENQINQTFIERITDSLEKWGQSFQKFIGISFRKYGEKVFA